MCRGSGVTGTAGSLPLAGGLCRHPQLRAVGPWKAPPSAAAKRLHDDRGHAGRGGRSGTAAASAGLARRRGSQPRASRAPLPRVTQRREAQCSVRSRAQRRLRGREGPTLPGTPEPGRHVEMRRFFLGAPRHPQEVHARGGPLARDPGIPGHQEELSEAGDCPGPRKPPAHPWWHLRFPPPSQLLDGGHRALGGLTRTELQVRRSRGEGLGGGLSGTWAESPRRGQGPRGVRPEARVFPEKPVTTLSRPRGDSGRAGSPETRERGAGGGALTSPRSPANPRGPGARDPEAENELRSCPDTAIPLTSHVQSPPGPAAKVGRSHGSSTWRAGPSGTGLGRADRRRRPPAPGARRGARASAGPPA